MKHTIIALILIVLFTSTACTSLPESPPVEPIKFELPDEPPDYTKVLDRIKYELGPAPQPTVINRNGITYFCFTKEQMVKFRLFNEAFSQLEEIIISQQKQAKIYFMELETLKNLAEAQNAQSKKYRELYEAARSEAKRKELESFGYKILTLGSLIAIIALAL